MRPPGGQPGQVVLRLDAVSCAGGRSGLVDCSVAIREGEVVGLAGLEGSGQEVFLRVAAGLNRPAKGSVLLAGQDMRGRTYHDFSRERVAYVPAARLEEALIPGLTIAEHAALFADGPGFGLNTRRADRCRQKPDRTVSHQGAPRNAGGGTLGGQPAATAAVAVDAVPSSAVAGNPDARPGRGVGALGVAAAVRLHPRRGPLSCFRPPKWTRFCRSPIGCWCFLTGG